MWMKPERSCFTKRERQWRDPTQLQHSKNIGEQSEHNAPVLQKVEAGHLMITANRGFQCGTFYLCPPRPVANWSNVAASAKGDEVLGVHVKWCACKKVCM